MSDPINYRDPTTPDPPPPRRTLGKWAVLLFIWFVGLIMWTIYLSVIAYVLFRII